MNVKTTTTETSRSHEVLQESAHEWFARLSREGKVDWVNDVPEVNEKFDEWPEA